MSRPLRIAALISGGGRTLMNLADRIDEGALDARIDVVVASRAEAPGVAKAAARGFRVVVAAREQFPDEEQRHDAIGRAIVESGADLVCLCGYLRWLRVDEHLRGRVMNIHPALLPEFGGRGMYGARVHCAVLESGARVSGCTVHFVDERYDHGPIILQRTCPVLPEDTVETLAERVFREECTAYPQAVRLFAQGRLTVRGDRVAIA